MCFSTEASFTAAVILGATGSATLRNTTSRSQFFLAAIPLLFAFQQFSEGLVWLHLSQNIGSNHFFINAQQAFLTFAFLIWPIWIPLSLALVETVSWRRSLLFINLYFGFALSIIYFLFGIKEETAVQVVNHSLQYIGHLPKQPILSIAYPIIVLLPMFLSSLKNVWIFGFLVTVGYITADYFYTKTFISVWCFFAAIVSLSIYKVLKGNQISLEKETLNE